tara:strand:- start:138 stop:509 length:372 start_codon:yes stop_codon:yes gene_type:complete
MPVKSTSASAVKSTSTRKRRTRKTSQTAAKSVAKVTPTLKTVSVKNVGQSPAKKVSTKKLKRPAKTVLTLNHYKRDFQSRVKIHNYEFNLFLEDCKKGLQLADKSLRNFYDYALQSYKLHFNV